MWTELLRATVPVSFKTFTATWSVDESKTKRLSWYTEQIMDHRAYNIMEHGVLYIMGRNY